MVTQEHCFFHQPRWGWPNKWGLHFLRQQICPIPNSIYIDWSLQAKTASRQLTTERNGQVWLPCCVGLNSEYMMCAIGLQRHFCEVESGWALPLRSWGIEIKLCCCVGMGTWTLALFRVHKRLDGKFQILCWFQFEVDPSGWLYENSIPIFSVAQSHGLTIN